MSQRLRTLNITLLSTPVLGLSDFSLLRYIAKDFMYASHNVCMNVIAVFGA